MWQNAPKKVKIKKPFSTFEKFQFLFFIVTFGETFCHQEKFAFLKLVWNSRFKKKS